MRVGVGNPSPRITQHVVPSLYDVVKRSGAWGAGRVATLYSDEVAVGCPWPRIAKDGQWASWHDLGQDGRLPNLVLHWVCSGTADRQENLFLVGESRSVRRIGTIHDIVGDDPRAAANPDPLVDGDRIRHALKC